MCVDFGFFIFGSFSADFPLMVPHLPSFCWLDYRFCLFLPISTNFPPIFHLKWYPILVINSSMVPHLPFFRPHVYGFRLFSTYIRSFSAGPVGIRTRNKNFFLKETPFFLGLLKTRTLLGNSSRRLNEFSSGLRGEIVFRDLYGEWDRAGWLYFTFISIQALTHTNTFTFIDTPSHRHTHIYIYCINKSGGDHLSAGFLREKKQ